MIKTCKTFDGTNGYVLCTYKYLYLFFQRIWIHWSLLNIKHYCVTGCSYDILSTYLTDISKYLELSGHKPAHYTYQPEYHKAQYSV